MCGYKVRPAPCVWLNTSTWLCYWQWARPDSLIGQLCSGINSPAWQAFTIKDQSNGLFGSWIDLRAWCANREPIPRLRRRARTRRVPLHTIMWCFRGLHGRAERLRDIAEIRRGNWNKGVLYLAFFFPILTAPIVFPCLTYSLFFNHCWKTLIALVSPLPLCWDSHHTGMGTKCTPTHTYTDLHTLTQTDTH